ncbi:MAG: hypothetical protein ACOCV8_00165 [Spirochaetota bacterium]
MKKIRENLEAYVLLNWKYGVSIYHSKVRNKIYSIVLYYSNPDFNPKNFRKSSLRSIGGS